MVMMMMVLTMVMMVMVVAMVVVMVMAVVVIDQRSACGESRSGHTIIIMNRRAVVVVL